jgi:hypothetical protein
LPKFTADHPFADPERAVRKPVEIANATEAVHDARFCIERINEQFLKAVDHQPNTWPASSAPSPTASYGATRAAPT